MFDTALAKKRSVGSIPGECGDVIDFDDAVASQRDDRVTVVLRDALDHCPPFDTQKMRRCLGQRIRTRNDVRALGQRIVRHFFARTAIRRAHGPDDARRRVLARNIFEE
jgi:hypothetical protein